MKLIKLIMIFYLLNFLDSLFSCSYSHFPKTLYWEKYFRGREGIILNLCFIVELYLFVLFSHFVFSGSVWCLTFGNCSVVWILFFFKKHFSALCRSLTLLIFLFTHFTSFDHKMGLDGEKKRDERRVLTNLLSTLVVCVVNF